MVDMSRLIHNVNSSVEFWEALRKRGRRSQRGFYRLGLDVSPFVRASSAGVETSCMRFRTHLGRTGMGNGTGFGRVVRILRRFRYGRYR
jgi:hypothetical protein